MTAFRDDMTLGEARAALRVVVDDGARCPCCRQFAKVYRRSITPAMLRVLAAMYREAGRDPVYLPALPQRSRDASTMRYFDLIEELPERRDDGGRAGWWRVTAEGEAFLTMGAAVPKYARVYDGRRLTFVGELVTAQDVAAGGPFDLREVLGLEDALTRSAPELDTSPVPPAPADVDLEADRLFPTPSSSSSAYRGEFA